MSVAAAQRRGEAQPVLPQPIAIEENTTLKKILSCIPLIGFLPSFIHEKSLKAQIKLSNNVPRMVELLKVKNQYKVMNIVRDFINIALIICGFAFGILGTAFCGICLGIYAIDILFNVERLSENKVAIHTLQARGFQPNLVIY